MTSSSAGRPRLLLVEDDEALRSMLARALGERGFDVITASTAAEGTSSVQRQAPDYAIFDLRLPDGSGLPLVTLLIESNPRARIVVLTGYGSIPTAVEAIKRGAANYLTKPITAVEDVVEAFDPARAATQAAPSTKPMSVQRLEREHIERVLTQCNGNISATARALSMHRRTLQRKLAKRPPRE